VNTQKTKERKTDRVLVLRPKAGEEAKSSKGMVDPRLFNGENKLHVTMDGQRLLWSFKYEHGGVPEALKQSFTNFPLAFEHAKRYFENRGIEIVDIQD
jgi:hypothetical protein